MKILYRVVLVLFVILTMAVTVLAQGTDTKTKFYNFDDLLIEGKVKKPQVLFINKREKVKFNRLLKLKKDFIGKLADTRKDHSLR